MMDNLVKKSSEKEIKIVTYAGNGSREDGIFDVGSTNKNAIISWQTWSHKSYTFTVTIYGSNDGSNYTTIQSWSITPVELPSGYKRANDGIISNQQYRYYKFSTTGDTAGIYGKACSVAWEE